ncbi:YheC/YheD family protein [Paenibacillus sp. MBLB4367]|uniref:YheC/YheD family endospore coat-associated protein n=1 Tax=Paenibacillus sp. MBLB4367 TaxID=3384767 RepID=UPI003907FF63
MERSIGIMVCEMEGEPPFADKSFYAKLCSAGEALGVGVFVFSPGRFDPASGTVTGFTFDLPSQTWSRRKLALPKLVYDRSFYTDSSQYVRHRTAVHELQRLSPIKLLGRSLSGKWEVQRSLAADPLLRPHLPKTERLRSMNQLEGWLNDRGEAFLKPDAGTHGKGALHVSACDDGRFLLTGRDRHNRVVSEGFGTLPKLLEHIGRRTVGSRYLIQQYLTLASQSGDAFDIRSLVQKDGTGRWQLTGMAVRRGQPGSVTSNLHGGGHAEELLPFLQSEFGSRTAQSLALKLHQLSLRISETLEEHYGRLAELGIDLGVDRSGNVWIIEVNSKPGRAVFAQIADERSAASAVRNPIAYARFLLDSATLSRPHWPMLTTQASRKP